MISMVDSRSFYIMLVILCDGVDNVTGRNVVGMPFGFITGFCDFASFVVGARRVGVSPHHTLSTLPTYRMYGILSSTMVDV